VRLGASRDSRSMGRGDEHSSVNSDLLVWFKDLYSKHVDLLTMSYMVLGS
jgi:hypothetical protein